MSNIRHHIPDPLLAAYASGALPDPYAMVVAAHVSLCDDCRAALEAHEAAGGAVLECSAREAVSDGLKSGIMNLLDSPAPSEPPRYPRRGVFPGPVMARLKGEAPRWKSLGFGTRQCILDNGPEGSVRLLYIPSGQTVPDHGHSGLELTMVLQGSFSDETGTFGVGDVEVADASLEHSPVADEGEACICLAATDAPLRFTSMVPRMLQPIFRI